MKIWLFISSCILTLLALVSYLLPLEKTPLDSIKGGPSIAKLRAHYLEADISQIEDARFTLDQRQIPFSSAPDQKTIDAANAQKQAAAASSTATQNPNSSGLSNDPQGPSFGWRLTGIVRGPRDLRAIFVSDTELISVVVGNQIDEWLIRRIDDNSVLLVNGSNERRLRLFNGDTDKKGKIIGSDAGYDRNAAPRSLEDFGPVKRNSAWPAQNNTSAAPRANLGTSAVDRSEFIPSTNDGADSSARAKEN